VSPAATTSCKISQIASRSESVTGRMLIFVMSTEVETSLNIYDQQQYEIELVRLPTLSPLPSRHNRPCRSSHSLHSSTSLGMTKGVEQMTNDRISSILEGKWLVGF